MVCRQTDSTGEQLFFQWLPRFPRFFPVGISEVIESLAKVSMDQAECFNASRELVSSQGTKPLFDLNPASEILSWGGGGEGGDLRHLPGGGSFLGSRTPEAPEVIPLR